MKPTTFVVVGLRLPSSSQRLVKRNVNGLAQTCNNYKPPRRVMKRAHPGNNTRGGTFSICVVVKF